MAICLEAKMEQKKSGDGRRFWRQRRRQMAAVMAAPGLRWLKDFGAPHRRDTGE